MTISKRKAASAIIIAVLLKKKRNKEQMKRLWVRRWIRTRETDDAALKLIHEIRNDDEKAFIDMFRLSGQQFDFLLERIRPLITKQNTNMRKSISAELRLSITLKFLSSGDSYRSLMYFFREFGIMAARFRMIRTNIELSESNTKVCVLAICALHNWLMSVEILPSDFIPEFDQDEIIQENNALSNNRSSNEAKEIRESFKNYFLSSAGEVSWQMDMI